MRVTRSAPALSSHADTPEARPPHRLGRVETAILHALKEAGGLMRRDEALGVAYPDLAGPRARTDGAHAESVECHRRRRAHAHAGLSRALATLERKGLIVKNRDQPNSVTTLRLSGLRQLPAWEQLARAEEELAAHCGRVAARWDALAQRAHRRARTIRVEHALDLHEDERRADLKQLRRLGGGTGRGGYRRVAGAFPTTRRVLSSR